MSEEQSDHNRILELKMQQRLLLRAMRCVLNSLEKYETQTTLRDDLIRSVLQEAINQCEKKND